MTLIKRNIFIIIGLCIIFIVFEIVTKIPYLALFGLGFLAIVLALFFKPTFLRRLFGVLGAFILVFVIFMTHSMILLSMALLMLWLLFKRDDGHEFFYSGDRRFHPFQSEIKYHDVVIRPQSEQRSLMTQTPFDDWVKESQEGVYYNQDINMVFLGGNTIIDLGNSFMTDGERTVVIRKIYGRTRIILPREIALKLNVSILSGRVVFEQQTYHLQGENFQWLTPQYFQVQRRINLIVSVVFGDIEVIIL